MANHTFVSWATKTQNIRALFYLVTPSETLYERIEDVPDFTIQVIPFFLMAIIMEKLVLICRGKYEFRINDTLTSLSAGMLTELNKVLLKYGIVTLYIWLYNNYRIIDVQWDSVWGWWICLIGIDFGNYWGHRWSHEINILWAVHQTHHSSEEYNITTAMRQSVVQKYIEGVFLLPLALGVPPTIFVAHLYLNYMSQFWIHTCAVGRLGIIDYIFNTPSNHRVHHGRNRFCIDKNYGAVFMIWDHMFGTYQAEKNDIVFGLVHPVNTFNPVHVQVNHSIYVWKLFWAAKDWRNKLSVLFKGPGWAPGKPRLGNIEDIPDISAPVSRYDPQIPTWCKFYALLHFIILVVVYQEFVFSHAKLGVSVIALFTIFLLVSLITFGAMFDKSSYSSVLETIRCIGVVLMHQHLFPPLMLSRGFLQGLRLLYGISSVLWLCNYQHWVKATKQD